jgi:anti-sigma factor (TIGR02949 family)
MEKRLLTCRELIDFLAAYLDGELPEPTRGSFERHLAACPACVDYLASYRETIRLGKQACRPDEDLPAEVPSELVEAILSARRR